MKQQEKLMAEQLFYQTDLTKTQIADCIGINRRTLTNWANDNHWDRIRTSARHMPSLIAENIYIAMAHLTNSIVAEDRISKPITETESKILHRLILDVNKLKNRATLNENLEMLRYFMEFVQARDPNAVGTIQPFVNDYIKSRAKVNPGQFMPPGFNDFGFIAKKEEDKSELQKDLEERRSNEDFPDQNQSETESPLSEEDARFIPNTDPPTDLFMNADNTLLETTSESVYKNIISIEPVLNSVEGSEESCLTAEEQHEFEEIENRQAVEITTKEVIKTTYQNLKQQNLNRAARRKLAQDEEKKKNITCSAN